MNEAFDKERQTRSSRITWRKTTKVYKIIKLNRMFYSGRQLVWKIKENYKQKTTSA